MDERLVEIAMEVIVNSGDARKKATEAIMAEINGDTAKVDELLEDAEKSIRKAHNAQTDVIQDETRGIKTEPTLLFIHAQDTVMTITSEIHMIKLMIQMYRKLKE